MLGGKKSSKETFLENSYFLILSSNKLLWWAHLTSVYPPDD